MAWSTVPRSISLSKTSWSKRPNKERQIGKDGQTDQYLFVEQLLRTIQQIEIQLGKAEKKLEEQVAKGGASRLAELADLGQLQQERQVLQQTAQLIERNILLQAYFVHSGEHV